MRDERQALNGRNATKRREPKVSKTTAARYIQLMLQNLITIDPTVCNGKLTSRGMRITVQTVLEYLSAGESQEEILRQFPMLEPEDISACLSFAGKLMAHSYSVKEIA